MVNQFHSVAKIRNLRNFAGCENFAALLLPFCFLLIFSSSFLPIALSSTWILHDRADSTILARLACKNYKISQKNVINSIARTLMCQSG